MSPSASSRPPTVDAVLVGAGIMSATLAAFLKELEPDWKIEIYERLGSIAAESSSAWNNAGTGHAALCELNYTPQKADGSIDISKALQINESFEISKQFWSYLLQSGQLANPRGFINPIPHLSFVRGEANVDFLRRRHQALSAHALFSGMRFSEDPVELASWIPLVMEGREPGEKVAATRVVQGTDVDFGALTRSLLARLQADGGVTVHLGQEIESIQRERSPRPGRRRADLWEIGLVEPATGAIRNIRARFVFLGAGGGALGLLQKSGIKEGHGFGGFPVSGQWLRCLNPELIARHHAKVYGMAPIGAPPMSVPHLDTRVIDGKKALLFGPYAGFSTRFLKHGSILDMPLSFRPDNVYPMIAAGLSNVDLTRYLIGQVLQSPEDRLGALRGFLPEVKMDDWTLEHAGQRVQVIKKDPKKGGMLQFGTEVICAGDGSIAALLGASPGASTSVSIMLTLLGDCFPDRIKSPAWRDKLKQMIPSYGESLAKDAALSVRVRSSTAEVLGLDQDVPVVPA